MSDEDPKPPENSGNSETAPPSKPSPRPDPRLESREKLGLKPDPKLTSIVQEGEQEDSTSENVAETPNEPAQEGSDEDEPLRQEAQ